MSSVCYKPGTDTDIWHLPPASRKTSRKSVRAVGCPWARGLRESMSLARQHQLGSSSIRMLSNPKALCSLRHLIWRDCLFKWRVTEGRGGVFSPINTGYCAWLPSCFCIFIPLLETATWKDCSVTFSCLIYFLPPFFPLFLPSSLHFSFLINFLKNICLFYLLAEPGLSCGRQDLWFSFGMWTLSSGMWNLFLWPGIKPRLATWWARSLSHWTTREFP